MQKSNSNFKSSLNLAVLLDDKSEDSDYSPTKNRKIRAESEKPCTKLQSFIKNFKRKSFAATVQAALQDPLAKSTSDVSTPSEILCSNAATDEPTMTDELPEPLKSPRRTLIQWVKRVTATMFWFAVFVGFTGGMMQFYQMIVGEEPYRVVTETIISRPGWFDF